MKIDVCQPRLYYIPLPEVLTDSTHGEIRHFAVITASVRTDEGAEGVGYTYTVGKTGGPAVFAVLENDLGPLLVGQDPRCIERLWQQMWWHLHYVGRGGIAAFAMAAVDIALWDLKAKLAGEPLWRVLGGHSDRARVYAGGIDLQLPWAKLAEQTQTNLERGFRAIKMKVGRERLDEDIERVAAMRDLIGPELPLMVDANMRWSVEQAICASNALAEFDVYWLEEPTIPDDVAGHQRIASEGPLSLAAGENLHTIYEFQKLIESKAVSFPEPDVANIGGVTPWLKIAHLAEAHNLPVTSHGVHDLHVHLLAAVPNASFLEAHGFGLDAYLREPLHIAEGFAQAPDRPGHGVQFDWDKLESHRIDAARP
jgi:L-alanine-DL-glutamate epimerase-like enolase superfamily enzyme